MRCLGRTETDRKITSEPWSSKQSLTEQIRPLFGVKGVMCSKKEKRGKKKFKKGLDRADIVKDSSRTQPAFGAKPRGAPIHHGFPSLSIVVEGFTFGKISDFDAEPCTEGDAFVVAPDNSRAGLVWEVSGNSYFQEVCPADSNRWGVWPASFPHPMTNHENVRRNFEHILPQLKRRWQEWRDAQLRG